MFYIICPLGLEETVLKELQLKWPSISEQQLPPHKLLKGGIELTAKLEQGLALNYILRSASRILFRIHSQKCRDLPKLFQIIKKIPWSKHLQQTNFEWKISTSKSRLIHTGKIEESASKALAEYFQGQSLSEYAKKQNFRPQKIYLRIEEDELTVSLDTTGEHLHKRQEYRGKASIRESLAAAFIIKLTDGDTSKKLLDPMCGSGTFLWEYRNFYQPLDRNFAFHNWKKTKVQIPQIVEPSIGKVTGLEIDSDVVKKLDPALNVQEGDFFKEQISSHYLILNPPYGKRIGIEGDKGKYFKHIIEKIKTSHIKKAGIIVPSAFAKPFKRNSVLKLNQNGIQVDFLVFEFK